MRAICTRKLTFARNPPTLPGLVPPKNQVGYPILVGTIVFLAWCAFVRGPYHFDDYVTPLDDPASQGLGAFFANIATTLRPLTKLTYALEATVGLQAHPWARRIVSCMMHAAATAVLTAIVQHEQQRRGTPLAYARTALLLVVVAYGLHPIHAESVLELSGRPSLLANALLLAAILAAQHQRAYLSATVWFLACMARETAIAGIVPLVVVVARGSWREAWSRGKPLVAAALCAIPIFMHNARMSQLARYSAAIAHAQNPLPMQWSAIPHGLSLWVRVHALSPDHGEALSAVPTSPLSLLGLAILASSMFIPAVGLLRPHGPLARSSWPLACALVFAALAPTQSFIAKLDALTERPFACALVCLPVLLAAPPCVRFCARWKNVFWMRAAYLSAIVLVAFWAARALLVRAPIYATEIALWQDAASKSVVNSRPYQNWIVSLEEAGFRKQALAAVKEARRKFPFDRGLRLTEELYRENDAKPSHP